MKSLILLELDGEPVLYEPKTKEVYLEFLPAKNYPIVLRAYLDNVVVPHNGRIYIPSEWVRSNFPEARTSVIKTVAVVRRLYRASLK